MKTIAEIVSQLPEANWTNALFAYGPLGIMCVFLMYLSNKKLDAISVDVITELRVLGHRMNGITRAMLADVASRENTGDALKILVQEELHKLDHEDEVRDIRNRAKRP
jgi:hypothetical protein